MLTTGNSQAYFSSDLFNDLYRYLATVMIVIFYVHIQIINKNEGHKIELMAAPIHKFINCTCTLTMIHSDPWEACKQWGI